MARDIRELLKEDKKLVQDKMPKGHEARFLQKLDAEFPKEAPKAGFRRFTIAASIVVLIGLTFGGYKMINLNQDDAIPVNGTTTVAAKTLEDVSPQLKKVEDYYMASINLELSKMKYTPESKELFDGYLLRLEELNNEYKRLSDELIQSGPNELTVNALIDNLKFRLNLLYRLRDKLNELNNSNTTYEEVQL